MNIRTVSGRQKLKPRREPYWRHLKDRGYIGLRKMDSGVETWQARWRQKNGKPLQKSLGRVTRDNDYELACQNARDWFYLCGHGITKTKTVKQACELYVAYMRKKKPVEPGERSPAQEAETVFKKWINDNPLGDADLAELTVMEVEVWRDSLLEDGKREPQSANRILRIFKAAMNHAWKKNLMLNNVAAKVEAFPATERRRETYLTREQIKEMLAAAPPDFAALVKGLLYTGCRPGELPKARVKDLNHVTGILTLRTSKGRTGLERSRSVPLAGDALEFFKAQAKSKHPNAFLLTKADGEPWTRQQWLRCIWDVRAAVENLPSNLVAYHLRHTTISNWLAAGVPVAQVAMTCGTSIQMIQKHYHQFIQDDELAKKLAAVKIV